MAPFGSEYGDISLDHGQYQTSDEMFLSPAFPYFGLNMTSIFVNLNGFLTFLFPCDANQCFYARPLPITSPPLIAALWNDYIVDNSSTTGVYYRITRDPEFLNNITNFVYEERYEHINFSYAIVVTWNELLERNSLNVFSRNTFQTILVTNGYTSYVVFSYGRLEIFRDGYSGFNFGDGFSHNSFNTSTIEEGSNLKSNIVGRYLYRVDGMYL